MIPLFKIFKSNYCKIVFFVSIVLVTILIPKKSFYGYFNILNILFIILTALIITCLTRNIKEKVYSAKVNGSSLFGIISIIIGVGAVQSCVIGAPICGASVGAGIIAILLPSFASNFFEKYSLIIIIISVLVQIIALYYMRCFKVKNKRL